MSGVLKWKRVLVEIFEFLSFLLHVPILELKLFLPPTPTLGRYGNSFQVAWSTSLLFDALNASTNMFVYYHMSSTYRQTLGRFLGWSRSTVTDGRH